MLTNLLSRMPSKWIDHAADPLDPRFVVEEDELVQDFSKDAKGGIFEMLMHCGHQRMSLAKQHRMPTKGRPTISGKCCSICQQKVPAGSGIYFVDEVYDRSPLSPGQYLRAFGLAHSSPTIQQMHQNASGAKHDTLGSGVLVHVCEGPSQDCLARKDGQTIFHIDAFRRPWPAGSDSAQFRERHHFKSNRFMERR